MSSAPSAWECTDDRYSLIFGIVTTSSEMVEAWREGGIKFEPLFRRKNLVENAPYDGPDPTSTVSSQDRP